MSRIVVDGIVIESQEGKLKEPKAEPKPIVKQNWYKRKTDDPTNAGENHHIHKLFSIPGYHDYYRHMRSRQEAIKVIYRDKQQLKYEQEREVALPMVEKITNKLNLTEIAEEALLDTVALMRAATNHKDKLSAAKQLLDFTMAKPVAKSEIKVSTAEDWLKSLSNDD